MAVYARTPTSSLDLPRAGRAAAPFALLASLALLFDADPRLPWLAGTAAAVCFAAAAAVRASGARRELARTRRGADRLILRSPRLDEASPLVAWRTLELTSPQARERLRGEIERTLRALDAALLPSASPLNRPAARRSEELLRRLAARLADERRVSPRGMLLATILLRDAASPLYNPEGEAELPRALARALGELG